MKNKNYCVVYSVPAMTFDVTIKAQSLDAAVRKVKEVIPDAFDFSGWEVKSEKKKEIVDK